MWTSLVAVLGCKMAVTKGINLKLGAPIVSAAVAGAKWATAGFPIVSGEGLAERKRICAECEFWNAGAFGGLGRCGKCGCSGVKLRMATSRCPLKKW